MSWAAVIAGGAAIVGSAVQANAAKKNKQTVSDLQYQPIDLDQLQKQAQAYAAENYANSLALEQRFQPELAALRPELYGQVGEDLKAGGNIPDDVYNQVAREAISGSNAAGLTGAAGPITAAMLGLTATQLRDKNQQKAASILSSNALPVAGLDPGSLASAALSQGNAQNQFTLNKAGAVTAANQSQANTWANVLGTLSEQVGKIKWPSSSGGSKPAPTGDADGPEDF